MEPGSRRLLPSRQDLTGDPGYNELRCIDWPGLCARFAAAAELRRLLTSDRQRNQGSFHPTPSVVCAPWQVPPVQPLLEAEITPLDES